MLKIRLEEYRAPVSHAGGPVSAVAVTRSHESMQLKLSNRTAGPYLTAQATEYTESSFQEDAPQQLGSEWERQLSRKLLESEGQLTSDTMLRITRYQGLTWCQSTLSCQSQSAAWSAELKSMQPNRHAMRIAVGLIEQLAGP